MEETSFLVRISDESCWYKMPLALNVEEEEL